MHCYMRFLPLMPKNLSEYPSPFYVSTSANLPRETNKQRNRENSDNERREGVQLVGPFVRRPHEQQRQNED